MKARPPIARPERDHSVERVHLCVALVGFLLDVGCSSGASQAAPLVSHESDSVRDLGSQGQCVSSSACGDRATPICEARTCRPCISSQDDDDCAVHGADTPRCDPASGRCVECRADTAASDCPTRAPLCDGGHCRGCRAHAECASGACDDDGSCADASAVIYVDARHCASIPDGSRALPFCQIQPAIAAAAASQGVPTPKRFVVAAGCGSPYGGVRIATSITLVGGAGGAASTTFIRGLPRGAAGIVVEGPVDVRLDGIDVAALDGDALSCAGKARLRVTRSNLHGAGRFGVNADDCQLTLDRVRVANNTAGGINLALTRYSITNTFVVDNGPAGAGLRLDDASSGTFAFNTVADNALGPRGAGGIDCGFGPPTLIESSIVWGNSRPPGGSQFAGPCVLRDVVTGDDPIASAIALDPAFSGAGPPRYDYHLVDGAADRSCCVDRLHTGATSAGAAVDHDFDGGPRPRGQGWDIGAHEVN